MSVLRLCPGVLGHLHEFLALALPLASSKSSAAAFRLVGGVPPLWRRDWRKSPFPAIARPIRNGSCGVFNLQKKVASVPRPLGMGRPCPTPCGVLRNPSQYFAASTRVLCGEYNPALRMPFVRFRQRAGRNHGRSFMARGNVRKPFLLCRARFTAVAKNIFPDVPFIWLFLGLSRFIPYFCSS